jgi:GntR family transcriptional repressor for pyruvate dehydrogenase complex
VDADFHYAVTAATHNPLQMHVLDSIHILFHTTIQVALTEFCRQREQVEKLLSQHGEILEAIAARDPERARQRMLDHLAMVEKNMTELLKMHSS